MRYLLDTNVCIHALNRADAGLAARLRATRRDDLCVSSVSVAELLYGAARSSRPAANAARVQALVEPLEEVAFDRAAATAYGPLRAALSARGTPISPMDLLIAATAIARGLAVVTNDRDFDRVPGLRVEDWTAGRA